jgi:hypothetical protein
MRFVREISGEGMCQVGAPSVEKAGKKLLLRAIADGCATPEYVTVSWGNS